MILLKLTVQYNKPLNFLRIYYILYILIHLFVKKLESTYMFTSYSIMAGLWGIQLTTLENNQVTRKASVQ